MMGKAMFQLKSQLEHNKMTQMPSLPSQSTISPQDILTQSSADDAIGLDDENVVVSVDGEVQPASATESVAMGESYCPSKPATGNHKVRVWESGYVTMT
jgi:hypothetical protein